MSFNRIAEHCPDAGGWLPRLPHDMNPTLRDWLTEQDSLTRRVQGVCDAAHPFSLRLLRHDFARPHRDEAGMLALPHHLAVRSREILLRRGDVPLVFAHSVVARADIRGAWASMDGIGGRSLGSVLFADRQVLRGQLHFKRLDARHPLYRKAAVWCGGAVPAGLWARRALFLRHGRPLLVSEVFLPAIMST